MCLSPCLWVRTAPALRGMESVCAARSSRGAARGSPACELRGVGASIHGSAGAAGTSPGRRACGPTRGDGQAAAPRSAETHPCVGRSAPRRPIHGSFRTDPLRVVGFVNSWTWDSEEGTRDSLSSCGTESAAGQRSGASRPVRLRPNQPVFAEPVAG